ncbi:MULTISPECIES: DUF1850 domain-containing protein [unclassified Chromohalobacter]|uniref:DUF1850 domain-containing protein n=1 Tax=unclassified Chromohalobacter TaxID=2628571 RepID=UPI002469947D|nr:MULTISPECIES: DUF1850 domain-containing protein [unclassified Chromohalobacter]
MPRKRWWIGGTVAIMAIATVLYPWSWLAVREGSQWRYAFPGWEGTSFTLRWTHSVEKEDWEEWFEVTEGGAIEITGTRFKTFGAGVPASAGKETHLEDGWVVMTGIDRVVDPLAVQAAPAEHYRMRYAGHMFALSHASPPPIYTFSVRRAPLWRVLPALVRPWLS